MLYPAGVQEYLDLGVHGYAMSRYSGCYVGMKAVTDTVESTASVIVDPDRVKPIIRMTFRCRKAASISAGRTPLEQEKLMHDYKIYMAIHYARVNKLNHIVIDSPRPRLGIMAAGKAYLDVRQALEDLGIDDELARAIGLRVFKVGMVAAGAGRRAQFASGLEKSSSSKKSGRCSNIQLKNGSTTGRKMCARRWSANSTPGRMGAPAW